MATYETAKTKEEQKALLLEMMYDSAASKVKFWERLGFDRSEAIKAAKRESCAGSAIWKRIESEA